MYIMTNRSGRVLYTGVTADLQGRVHQHRTDAVPDSFTARYRAHRLVYYEAYPDIRDAIRREKQIKGWLRSKKVALVESLNPGWDDLWDLLSS